MHQGRGPDDRRGERREPGLFDDEEQAPTRVDWSFDAYLQDDDRETTIDPLPPALGPMGADVGLGPETDEFELSDRAAEGRSAEADASRDALRVRTLRPDEPMLQTYLPWNESEGPTQIRSPSRGPATHRGSTGAPSRSQAPMRPRPTDRPSLSYETLARTPRTPRPPRAPRSAVHPGVVVVVTASCIVSAILCTGIVVMVLGAS